MIYRYLALLSGLALFSQSGSATADDASITITADYVSEYVFRGVTLAGEAIQPAVEANYGPWTLGVWSSFAIGGESEAFADEIDFYIGYGWELGDIGAGEVGATLYHFPQSGGVFDVGAAEAGTVELFGSLDFDMFLAPNLSAFYDIHLETVTLEATLSQTILNIDPFSLEVSANVGGVEASGQSSLDYAYGKLSTTLYLDVTDKAAIYAGASYGASSADTFLDTNFDLSDPDTLSDPTDQSTWFTFGLSSTF